MWFFTPSYVTSCTPVTYLSVVHEGCNDTPSPAFPTFTVYNCHMQRFRVQPRLDRLAHTARREQTVTIIISHTSAHMVIRKSLGGTYVRRLLRELLIIRGGGGGSEWPSLTPQELEISDCYWSFFNQISYY